MKKTLLLTMVTVLLCFCAAAQAASANNSFDTATPVVLSESGYQNEFTIQADDEYLYWSFTPAEDAEYIFTTDSLASNLDNYGVLYNSQRVEIAYNDDGGDGNLFRIASYLHADSTYYLGVRMYNSSTTGHFMLNITKVEPKEPIVMSETSALVLTNDSCPGRLTCRLSAEMNVVSMNGDVTVEAGGDWTISESFTYGSKINEDGSYDLICQFAPSSDTGCATLKFIVTTRDGSSVPLYMPVRLMKYADVVEQAQQIRLESQIPYTGGKTGNVVKLDPSLQLISLCDARVLRWSGQGWPSDRWAFLETIGGIPCLIEYFTPSSTGTQTSNYVCYSADNQYYSIIVETTVVPMEQIDMLDEINLPTIVVDPSSYDGRVGYEAYFEISGYTPMAVLNRELLPGSEWNNLVPLEGELWLSYGNQYCLTGEHFSYEGAGLGTVEHIIMTREGKYFKLNVPIKIRGELPTVMLPTIQTASLSVYDFLVSVECTIPAEYGVQYMESISSLGQGDWDMAVLFYDSASIDEDGNYTQRFYFEPTEVLGVSTLDITCITDEGRRHVNQPIRLVLPTEVPTTRDVMLEAVENQLKDGTVELLIPMPAEEMIKAVYGGEQTGNAPLDLTYEQGGYFVQDEQGEQNLLMVYSTPETGSTTLQFTAVTANREFIRLIVPIIISEASEEPKYAVSVPKTDYLTFETISGSYDASLGAGYDFEYVWLLDDEGYDVAWDNAYGGRFDLYAQEPGVYELAYGMYTEEGKEIFGVGPKVTITAPYGQMETPNVTLASEAAIGEKIVVGVSVSEADHDLFVTAWVEDPASEAAGTIAGGANSNSEIRIDYEITLPGEYRVGAQVARPGYTLSEAGEYTFTISEEPKYAVSVPKTDYLTFETISGSYDSSLGAGYDFEYVWLLDDEGYDVAWDNAYGGRFELYAQEPGVYELAYGMYTEDGMEIFGVGPKVTVTAPYGQMETPSVTLVGDAAIGGEIVVGVSVSEAEHDLYVTAWVDDPSYKYSAGTYVLAAPNKTTVSIYYRIILPGEYRVAAKVARPGYTLSEEADFSFTVAPGKELILPQNVTVIEEESFADCGIETVTIPEGCTAIGSKAFANNQNLYCVYLPKTKVTIAGDAFAGCTNQKLTFVCYGETDNVEWCYENGYNVFELPNK